MLIPRPAIDRCADPVRPSEILTETLYRERRTLLKAFALGALASAVPPWADAALDFSQLQQHGPFDTGETLTTWEDATTYNNFYEFGTGKEDPAMQARNFKPLPWNVAIGGACAKPGRLDLDALLAPHALEERIYRLRCVEAWSMVIPWVGVPLGAVLKRFEPMGSAKYVVFRTLHDPARMPGQRSGVLDWPYREGLRIDEAMHPLTLLAVGMYGKALPNQNGAPLRLVVPWKYGFKSIKSIVAIDFVEHLPRTTWNDMAPDEYGFYANVNPEVDHPRWSQRSERRLAGSGNKLFRSRITTLKFNGYGEQVAALYAGMDLRERY